MRIKKFTAPTMKEATEQMKRELGPEAIILNTRKMGKSTMVNFLGKEMVEVTAAIDEPLPKRARPESRSKSEEEFRRILQQEKGERDIAPETPGTIDDLRSMAQQFDKRSQRTVPVGQAEYQQLRDDVDEIKATLATIAEHFKYSKMPALPEPLRQAYARLVNNDVDERQAADIVQAVYGKLNDAQLSSRSDTEKALLSEIARSLKTAALPRGKSKSCRIVALVGPTGVGKTTTIAKLAAISKLINRLDVGLISADTYRIGAIEQLRTFAGIADIPMEVVYKPKEIAAAVKKFRNKDIVFIDTVGRNQKLSKDITELKKFLEAAAPDEIHLVVSGTTGKRTLSDVVNKFSMLKANRLILSKMDEAASVGSLLNVLQESQIPVSYITTGQTVPDDIITADSAMLAKLVYNGVIGNA
ncbi:MAG: flagellar biosynthesis protein FlhF [Ignavibacteriales bacterium]|nr:flagellar biosynthesis protein FlhF [Ignavibacteriales bacterium]